MRRAWCVLFLSATVPFAAESSSAVTGIRVDETSTKLALQREQIEFTLAIENSLAVDVATRIKIELVDPLDRVRAVSERDATLLRGRSTIAISLAFSLDSMSDEASREIIWFRLRYQIRGPGNTGVPLEGILSLSEITPGLFELRVASSRVARPGSRLRVSVRAVQPAQRLPVSGVAVEGEIQTGHNQLLKASGVTDPDGYASLDFDLPARMTTREADLRITGRLGALIQREEEEIQLDRFARILTSTDKPLYQPGQSLHARALVFDSSNRAIAGHNATLKITDPENNVAFRAALKTSRFGVASADWQIPDTTRLGRYLISVEIDDEQYQTSNGGQYVSISRYDLPNFTVNGKADRVYYLPGQRAEVRVRADYLFGRPVRRGHARVVRETEREWNFTDQKWDIEEGDKFEGDFKDGLFVAGIDLAREHEELSDEDYQRFRDVEYAAYITDSMTGRTEQRRFRLRVTKEPIHIYVGRAENIAGFPLQFYLSTSYADGTPAECEVSIGQDPESPVQQGETGTDANARPLRAIRTNRYGVAKVSGLELSSLEINVPPAAIKGSTRAELKIYPNLIAHVTEGIEAIMQRPHGCGEQTVSSTYPSLIVLRHYKQRAEEFPLVAEKARRYLQAGYRRLLNYRSSDGGFTYWGRGDADTALTAYALRFLTDARDLTDVDEDVIHQATEWLIKRQRADGSWTRHSRSSSDDKSSDMSLTALVARVLARSMRLGHLGKFDGHGSIEQTQSTAAALKHAIDYLAARAGEIKEPYLIAGYALAAFDSGQVSAAARAVSALRALARQEGDATYWSSEGTTPFYGWGVAGRIETTALALQALALKTESKTSGDSSESDSRSAPNAAAAQQELVSRGLLFLISHKDRYGVWHSSQATVNVMDALEALFATRPSGPRPPGKTAVLINGSVAAYVEMPEVRRRATRSRLICLASYRLEQTASRFAATTPRMRAPK